MNLPAARKPKVFGLVGWSGSGKTTLMVRLIPLLRERGLKVSTMKHAHHTFDVDQPGKDSYRHREVGADEVLISSARRWALMHENRDEPEPDLDHLLRRMSPVDLILVEGFKGEPYPKLEVNRREAGQPLLCRDDPDIVAIAADYRPDDAPLPVLDIDDPAAIVDFIVDRCGLGGAQEPAA